MQPAVTQFHPPLLIWSECLKNDCPRPGQQSSSFSENVVTKADMLLCHLRLMRSLEFPPHPIMVTRWAHIPDEKEVMRSFNLDLDAKEARADDSTRHKLKQEVLYDDMYEVFYWRRCLYRELSYNVWYVSDVHHMIVLTCDGYRPL